MIASDEHAKFTHRDDTSIERIEAILLDTMLLSECEYVIATASSNIGRLIYEIRSLKYRDVTESLTFLRDSYSTNYFFT